MRKSLCSIVLALSIGCSNQEVIQDHLTINRSSRNYHIVNQNWRKGIKDILGILSTNHQEEESWIYLPKEKLWVEIGHDHRERMQDGLLVGASVQYNFSRIAEYLKDTQEDSFFHVHNHPPDIFYCPSDDGLSILKHFRWSPVQIADLFSAHIRAFNNLPSVADMTSSYKIFHSFDKHQVYHCVQAVTGLFIYEWKCPPRSNYAEEFEKAKFSLANKFIVNKLKDTDTILHAYSNELTQADFNNVGDTPCVEFHFIPYSSLQIKTK